MNFSSAALAQLDDYESLIKVKRGSLFTKVYPSESKRGTILIRTPYFGLDSYTEKIDFWNNRGFTVVVQSIAGTGDSTGQFKYLTTDEIQDAKSTLNWIVKQSFYVGRVVLFGESYDGFLALAGAVSGHESVKAVVAASAPTNVKLDSFGSGGMIEFDTLKYYLDVSSNKRSSKRNFQKKIKTLYHKGTKFSQYDNYFVTGGVPDWDSLISESLTLNFLNRGVYEHLYKIKVPVLLMAGEIFDQDATDAIHSFHKKKVNLKTLRLSVQQN